MKSETRAKVQRIAISNGELVRFAVRVVSQTTTGGNVNTPHTLTENKHWMVVDDNQDILELMSMMLPPLTDAAIEYFNSPQEALAAFTAAPEKYELVITDYEMPGMDGVELCRRIRTAMPTQKVFLTTGSGFFTGAAAQHAGFSGLLNKPFPMALFQDMLTNTGVAARQAAVAA